jgi:hypothetical protein
MKPLAVADSERPPRLGTSWRPGAVNTGTTPKVQYTYSQDRLTSIVYPNGRTIKYNYATGVDNTISRLTWISQTIGMTTTTLESYSYLGLDTVVKRAHAQPGADLTYIKHWPRPLRPRGRPTLDQDQQRQAHGSHPIQLRPRVECALSQQLSQYPFDELYHANGAGNGYGNLNQLSPSH